MKAIKTTLSVFKTQLGQSKPSSALSDVDVALAKISDMMQIQESVKAFQDKKNFDIEKLLASKTGGSVSKEGLANLKAMIDALSDGATTSEQFAKAVKEINLAFDKLSFNAKTTQQAKDQADATLKNAEAFKKEAAYLEEQARQAKENKAILKLMANTTEEVRAKFDALNFEYDENITTVKELKEAYKLFKQELNAIKKEAELNPLEKH